MFLSAGFVVGGWRRSSKSTSAGEGSVLVSLPVLDFIKPSWPRNRTRDNCYALALKRIKLWIYYMQCIHVSTWASLITRMFI